MYLWKWFLAYFRLSRTAICEMSVGRGLFDCFHDYSDSAGKIPEHFSHLTCERCGKKFFI